MSHPLKDVLFIRYAEQFYVCHFGSPAGELNTLIETPDLFLINKELWREQSWDYIIIDTPFDWEDFYFFIVENFWDIRDKIICTKLQNKNLGKIKEEWCE